MICVRCLLTKTRGGNDLCSYCLTVLGKYRPERYTANYKTNCSQCKADIVIGSKFVSEKGQAFCEIACASKFFWKKPCVEVEFP